MYDHHIRFYFHCQWVTKATDKYSLKQLTQKSSLWGPVVQDHSNAGRLSVLQHKHQQPQQMKTTNPHYTVKYKMHNRTMSRPAIFIITFKPVIILYLSIQILYVHGHKYSVIELKKSWLRFKQKFYSQNKISFTLIWSSKKVFRVFWRCDKKLVSFKDNEKNHSNLVDLT